MKLVSLVALTCLISNSVVLAGQEAATPATTRLETRQTLQAAEVKAKVRQRGVGKKSSVRAKLVSGNEVKGFISKIEETSFTLTDKKTGLNSTIPYADVQRLRGPGFSHAGVIAMVAVGGAAVVLVVIGILVAHAD